MQSSTSSFIDTATDCAICLEPLASSKNITLTCGHIWHLECIQEQLRLARPDFSRRLLFTGYRCAKCSRFCEHPLLDDIVRPISHLQNKVDQILLQQARVDELHTQSIVASPGSAYYNNLLAYARTFYAIFMCSICKNPYFGGTIECAEQAQPLPSEEKFCERCSPRTASTCTISFHYPFYIWKCRYCCHPADFVCYGSTHYCNSCHRRDRGEPNSITAIPCPGRPTCTHPFRSNQTHHQNGSTAGCEEVYGCVACASDPIGTASILPTDRGSANLVYNRSGEHVLSGWHSLSDRWKVQPCEVPLLQNQTNFVSSYNWCAMAQTIDLSQYIRNPSNIMLEFSARYLARADCPSVFILHAAVFNDRFEELKHENTEKLNAPADYWDCAKIVFEPIEAARYAIITICGKDSRFWAGDYGSKVAECSVRVLYDDSVTDENAVMFENGIFGANEVPQPNSGINKTVANRLRNEIGRACLARSR